MDSTMGLPRRRARRLLLRAAPAGLLLATAGLVRAEVAPAALPLRIGGTGSGLAPLQRVFDAAGVPARFVPSLGSGGGIKAVMAGAIDIALTARPLSGSERGAGLVERELFHTPFVWAVNPSVPKQRTTLAELADLYSGRTAQWSDGQPVRLVLRPESDSDSQYVRAISPEMARALTAAEQRHGLKFAVTDDEALHDIERIAGALGSTTLALVLAFGRPVRVLDLDGVTPTLEALRAARYPYRRTVRVVTRSPAAAPVAAALQGLHGSASLALLARVGCLPASEG